jgi:hypothetical protein
VGAAEGGRVERGTVGVGPGRVAAANVIGTRSKIAGGPDVHRPVRVCSLRSSTSRSSKGQQGERKSMEIRPPQIEGRCRGDYASSEAGARPPGLRIISLKASMREMRLHGNQLQSMKTMLNQLNEPTRILYERDLYRYR